ncbi:DUF1475 family protein [Novipirellula artificiosorum]|uniref:DUF1475 domain-containing protein n=1 Tax=Novipirellula artificiosorum TaxID=2528016 RepID=A0A5C6DWZ9_9BACT|nr:DUF1475 family protein [Novipirellula artificiosorum]TWU40915.1 hypothetical protein Poly41_17500 [Novipirellula artificiosorum]
MTRAFLLSLFGAILVVMIAVTFYASLDRSVFKAGSELLSDRWFVATLFDAYCGFLTFYVWVAYKERTLLGKGLWFILILMLGNIAMSIYLLIQLAKLDRNAGITSILLRNDETTRPIGADRAAHP